MPRGAAVDRYLVTRVIGRGGMGVVYAAYDPRLDRRVALKLVEVNEDGSSHGDEGRSRLLREARAIAQLDHPNVIGVHDVGIHQGDVFIAMEYVDGLSMRRWLNERKPSRREILRVLHQAGRGLVAAHRAGLVHRDFKPDNVLVAEDERGKLTEVKVADFGLARGDDDADLGERTPDTIVARALEARIVDEPLVSEGGIGGTPAYMAPEQQEYGIADTSSDQYAFCVSAWEALTGRRPWEASTTAELFEQKMLGPPTDSRGVPSGLREALQRGLQPEPEQRWDSLQQLVERIRPRERSRRIWPWVLLTMGAGGLAFVVTQGLEPPSEECHAPAEDLAGIWDEERKEAIRDAVEASELIYAEDTWRRVERTLDEYASSWLDAQVALCEAVRLHAELPAGEAGARRRCLERRRLELGELSEQLLAASPKTVERAAVAARSLSTVASCEGDVVNAASDGGDRSAALRERLGTARAQRAAGQVDSALALASEVRDDAALAEDFGTVAESSLQVAAMRLDAGGDYEDQNEDFERAAVASLRASDEHRLVRSWIGELRNATDRNRHEEARVWADYATRGVNSVRDDGLRADWAAAMVWYEIQTGQHDELDEHCALHLDLRMKEFGAEHPTTAGALNLCGIAAYMQRRKDEAVDYYRRGLAISEAVSGPEHPGVSAYLNNIGVVLTDQKRYDEAVKYYERSLAIREKNFPSDHPHVIQSLTNLANLHLFAAQHAQAVEPAREALDRLIVDGIDPVQRVPHELRYGRALAGAEQWKLARETLTHALDDLPEDPARLPGCRRDVLEALAGVHEALGERTQKREISRQIAESPAKESKNLRRCTDEMATFGRGE